MNQQTEIKRGMTGFGVVGNYPPAAWRFDGTRNGSCVLTHSAALLALAAALAG